MTAAVRWIDAPEDACGWHGEPIGWIVAPDDPRRAAWLASAVATAAELSDFAGRGDAGDRVERRQLARLLIGNATARHPTAAIIGRKELGAPTVDEHLHLSVAGSRSWAFIAVAGEPIGADIEMFDDQPPLWDMLTNREAIAVRADADPARIWLRHWVAKEAHAKRLGDPRRADPAAIEIGEGTARSPQGTSRVEWRVVPGAIAAVALPA